MKVLTAGRGDRADDFNTGTVDGELVFLTEECEDEECGCWRAFVGATSDRATSVAVVRDDLAVTFEDLVQAAQTEGSRWDEDDAVILAAEMVALAARYDGGHVLRRERSDIES